MSAQRSSYQATVASSDDSGNEFAATIYIDAATSIPARSIQVESPEIGLLEIPFDDLQIEQNVSGRWLLYDTKNAHTLIWTNDPRLLEDQALLRHPRLRMQVKELRAEKEQNRNLKLATIFLAVVITAGIAAWLIAGQIVNFVVAHVPISWEQTLGNSVFGEIKTEMTLTHDDRREAELRAIVSRLTKTIPANGYKFEIFLVDLAEPNAFAIPGGRVFVNTGLFTVATNSNEIAGVLAHELAHVTRRHGLRQIVSSVGPYYLASIVIGDSSGLLGALAGGSQLLLQQSFSREFERDADETGWKYLVAANVDPRGLRTFLSKLAADPKIKSAERSSLKVLSSHPPTTERIENLENLWQHSAKKSGFTPIEVPERGK